MTWNNIDENDIRISCQSDEKIMASIIAFHEKSDKEDG